MSTKMCKVMMIDDDPMQHWIMQRMLDKLDVMDKPEHLYSGNAAMTQLQQNEENVPDLPSLVLLDLHMPEINGWDLLEFLDQFSTKAKTKINVYVVTSSIDNNDRERANAYSFVKGFISKPVTKDRLKDLYEQHIETPATRQAS
ncbi:response regulator [Mucilaginibacter daejeonensis]|uniref:response regulator n=1 Tax=Mucilaginibacter daejeonensis TaxID=398049 RepID=UPI001D170102|nr:response regulator [Mucilaginibacter daejeonensis]UEG53998.1 response regulator [Mucilaginibacter daejeonensis]